MLAPERDHARAWDILSAALGAGYFVAWSVSFYPQLILNYKRKRTTGLSPDFIILNPLGFLFLTIYNFSLALSPLARSQYASRHASHTPQVSPADLAFSLHALVISLLTLLQVGYYNLAPDAHARLRRWLRPGDERERERERLLPLSPPLPARAENGGLGGLGLGSGSSGVSGVSKLGAMISESIKTLVTPPSPTTPSPLGHGMLAAIILAVVGASVGVWVGKIEWLDWLYVASTIKLAISTVKYLPQVWLNARLRSAEGFAITAIILDMAGAILSFAQLVISSVSIAHDPSGIIANPAKLGLSALSFSFDVVFVLQKYVLYRGRRIEDPDEDPDADVRQEEVERI